MDDRAYERIPAPDAYILIQENPVRILSYWGVVFRVWLGFSSLINIVRLFLWKTYFWPGANLREGNAIKAVSKFSNCG